LAWKLIKKLCTKFKLLGDTIASAEQIEKLMKLKLKKKQDPEYLKSKIASLETSYGCQIEEKLKIAAIVKAGGKQYSADILSKMKAIKGLVVTSRAQTSFLQRWKALESLEMQIRTRMTAATTK